MPLVLKLIMCPHMQLYLNAPESRAGHLQLMSSCNMLACWN